MDVTPATTVIETPAQCLSLLFDNDVEKTFPAPKQPMPMFIDEVMEKAAENGISIKGGTPFSLTLLLIKIWEAYIAEQGGILPPAVAKHYILSNSEAPPAIESDILLMAETPAVQAVAIAGAIGLNSVIEITGVPRSTLNDWHADKPKLFRTVLLGCKAVIDDL